jgi:hypothetical protein
VFGSLGANEGIIESVTSPSGEKWTFFYQTATACAMPGCTGSSTIRRLNGVRNSFGYLIKFGYPVNGSTIDALQSAQWWTYNQVTGINTAVAYCNPAAETCPNFSQTWPKATYVRIPVDAGPQFRPMKGQDSGRCRATIPEDAGPV